MKKSILSYALVIGFSGTASAGYTGPSDLTVIPVSEALDLGDDAPVALRGNIEKHISGDRYLFSDGTGSIVVEIDEEDWKGQTVSASDTVHIYGEIEKEWFRATYVDAEVVSIVK
jgi:uncharacterized protein (TIGR00156 family)